MTASRCCCCCHWPHMLFAVVDDTADLPPAGKEQQYRGYVLSSDEGVSEVGTHR